ncbi:MAG: hypothetical protein ACOC4G_12980 [Bacillota bacterium]
MNIKNDSKQINKEAEELSKKYKVDIGEKERFKNIIIYLLKYLNTQERERYYFWNEDKIFANYKKDYKLYDIVYFEEIEEIIFDIDGILILKKDGEDIIL